MNNLDPTQPAIKNTLQQAVRSHACGDFMTASDLRDSALDQLDLSDPRYPGVLSTQAFVEARQSRSVPDFTHKMMRAQLALDSTDSAIGLVEAGELGAVGDLAILRQERPATEGHLGVLVGGLALRAAYRKRWTASGFVNTADGHIQQAWRDSQALQPEEKGIAHQTRINFARRAAAWDGLNGRPFRGLVKSVGAIGLGFISESPYLARNNTPDMSISTRLRSRAKAVVGGMVAGVVCAANLPGIRRIKGNVDLHLAARMEGFGWLLRAEEHPDSANASV